MGEPIWTTMKIKTPPTWRDPEKSHQLKPIESFSAGTALEYYLDDVDADEADDHIVWMWQGEANYGMAADTVQFAMSWCFDHRVPFVAWDDSKYEFQGQIVFYDGTNPSIERPHGEGGVELSGPEFKRMFEKHSHNDAPTLGLVWEVIAHFVEIDYQLASCDISHLDAFPPPDPDERLSFDECEAAGVDPTLRSYF